jgi:hypothetical protein
MLIWIANLRYDAIWFLARGRDGWQYVGATAFVLQFMVPFFLLLMRDVKQRPWALATVAGLILAMHLVYQYWQVLPAFETASLAEHWIDVITPFAVGGLWLGYFVWQLRLNPVLPRHDENRLAALHLRGVELEAAAREGEVAHG